MTFQARSSYLPNEILWGYRFSNLVSYTKESRFYQVDFKNLNAVKPDDTPRMSVRDLDLEMSYNYYFINFTNTFEAA
jgi:potassium inwardly-rectifying channel subfamily J